MNNQSILKELCEKQHWEPQGCTAIGDGPPWTMSVAVRIGPERFAEQAVAANKKTAKEEACRRLLERLGQEGVAKHCAVPKPSALPVLNPVSKLNDHLQRLGRGLIITPTYSYRRFGPDHCPAYEATVRVDMPDGCYLEATGGRCPTKAAADQAAADALLPLMPTPEPGNWNCQFKGLLQETAAAAGFGLPQYNTQPSYAESGTGYTSQVVLEHPDSTILFACGSDLSKQRAEDNAAEQLLAELQPLLPFQKTQKRQRIDPDLLSPISQLNELVQNAAWSLEWSNAILAGPPHYTVYEATVTINGVKVAMEHGHIPGIQAARCAAAEAALHCFTGPDVIAPHDVELGSLIEHLSLERFTELCQQSSFGTFETVVSCLLVEGIGGSGPWVVSLGTGTTYYTGAELGASMGEVLTDCHAEVVARRGLLRYLYAQAAAALQGAHSDIFQRQPAEYPGVPLKLVRGLKLHLYISAPPCGDAKYSSKGAYVEAETWPQLQQPSLGGHGELLPCSCDHHWPRNCHLLNARDARSGLGVLRSKTIGGESESPLPRVGESSAIAGRLCKMTCSDKIARWNALGVQGALLSRLVEPIYLSSVTIGSGFSHGALARALCCRLSVDGNASSGLQLQAPFHVQHPRLLHGAANRQGLPKAAGHGATSSRVSLNWNIADGMLEEVDGSMGKQHLTGATSRLSKRKLYDLFKPLAPPKATSYREAKDASTFYAAARQALYDYFQTSSHSGQAWMRRSASTPSMEHFQ